MDIFERMSLRVDQLVDLEKFRSLRREWTAELKIKELVVDYLMLVSIAEIFQDKELMELFREMESVHDLCPGLYGYEKKPKLHTERIDPEDLKQLRRIYAKLINCFRNGFFDDIRIAS